MARLTSNLHTHGGMHSANKKVLVVALALLLGQLACHAHSLSECCRQSSRSCRLYVLLCRSDGKTPSGPLASDAAAGILTLGKRAEEEQRLHSRLHRLLQGSRNQAAGILTMGRREEGGVLEPYGGGWVVRAQVGTPLPL